MTNEVQMSIQENAQKNIQENMQKGAQGNVQKNGRVSAAFIVLLCMLPAVNVLNMLINIFSLIYRYMMYPQLPMTDIVSLLTSAAKTVGVWCVGLLPVIVLTVMRKIDPMRIRVRDVIMWGIWCLSGLSIFHTITQTIMARYGSYVLVSYLMAVNIKEKLSVSWLWPWLLLLLFLLVRSGTLRPSKIKFFVTAGVLAVWSLVLLILISFLLGGAPQAGSGAEHITDLLRSWLLGQWTGFPETTFAYAGQYLQVWACFAWLQCLVEIWFAAVYGEEKIRWSGLAFVLGLPLFTLAMTFVNLIIFQMSLSSYPLATGASAVIGCIALIIIYIVGKIRSQAHT
ncbi:MAG: hypothetical protein HDR26_06520 [Lachnospiraceae bacterium]|nr:hypothetical protein [Lachnospiraceae bacterium]